LREMLTMDSYNILVVDDEECNLHSLKRTFRREYNVFSAVNGKDALNIMEENDIAIVITDNNMPGMTGPELLARTSRKCPNAIRIILTGYSDEKTIRAAIKRGQIHRYITKPWEPEEIKSVVRQGIAAYEASLAGKSYTGSPPYVYAAG